MKLRPLHNQVALKQLDNSELRNGNIIIPDTGKEKPRLGTVVAVGVGTFTIAGELIPIQVKVGDLVAFPSMGGQVVFVENEEYVLIKDVDLLTVIEK